MPHVLLQYPQCPHTWEFNTKRIAGVLSPLAQVHPTYLMQPTKHYRARHRPFGPLLKRSSATASTRVAVLLVILPDLPQGASVGTTP